MPVTAVHALLYTPRAEELRALLGGAFGWSHVDAGGGWPIYALPPAELAVHPAEHPRHELSLMCDDLSATMDELRARGITFLGEPEQQTWGTAVTMRLPGDVEVLLYEPRHPTAHAR